MKKIFLIIILLLLTGCSEVSNDINYNLYIDTTYHEKITFNLSKDAKKIAKENAEFDSYTSLEYKLLEEDNEPIYSNHNKFYNKDIDYKINSTVVTLDYEYIEDDFMNSNYIRNCFENYKLVSTDNTFEVNLNGKFYCYNNKKINILVDGIFEVIETNGEITDEGVKFTIDENNYNNIDIKYNIKRNHEGMSTSIDNTKENTTINSIMDILWIIFLIICLILLLYLYKKKVNNNSNV